jgi:hypothetical protein
MAHNVAILITTDTYNDYDQLSNSITEWEEISHEDFLVLQAASYRKGFKILEQPVDVKDFIAKTVSEEIARAKAAATKLEEEKAKRAEAAKLKKYKKDLKDKESKIALLKKLQEELGSEIT